MTAEEKAAVEWLEEMPELEHMQRFRPPAGENMDLFSLKRDHERTYSGNCYRCQGAERQGALVVIE